MADKNGYIGRAPSDSSVTIARQNTTSVGVQTTFVFNAGYDVGYLDVYLNGSKLVNVTDYTATDTQNVTLDTPTENGDVLEFVAYKAFTVSNVITETPGDLTVDGSLTATYYYGDGSNLTGITTTFLVDGGGTIRVQANTFGAVVTGIVTATSFVGDVTGNVTGTAGGLSGTPNITVGTVTGNLTGDVTGNLTGDVTGGTITASTGANLNGYKVEEGDIETTSLNGEFDYNLENGHIEKFTGSTGGNYQPDFKVNGSTTLSSIMDVGDVVTCTLMVASSSHYLASASIKIDDSASNLDIDNVGGSAPSGANGSGFDIYTFTIQKTAATPAYHIVVNTLGAN